MSDENHRCDIPGCEATSRDTSIYRVIDFDLGRDMYYCESHYRERTRRDQTVEDFKRNHPEL